jgi:hypothetical protein
MLIFCKVIKGWSFFYSEYFKCCSQLSDYKIALMDDFSLLIHQKKLKKRKILEYFNGINSKSLCKISMSYAKIIKAVLNFNAAFIGFVVNIILETHQFFSFSIVSGLFE